MRACVCSCPCPSVRQSPLTDCHKREKDWLNFGMMAHRCKCLKKDSWNVTELKKDNIVRNISVHTGGHQCTY